MNSPILETVKEWFRPFRPFLSSGQTPMTLGLAAVGAILFGSPAQSEAADVLTRYMELEGKTVAVKLFPKRMSKYGLSESEYSHLHYDLHLHGHDDSEGRVTWVDGGWQGILLHEGRIVAIQDLAEAPNAAALEMRYMASEIPQERIVGQCGGTPSIPAGLQTQIDHPITLKAMMASQINYDSFCDSTVDGVCLVAELSVAFDTLFRTNHFGQNSETQAIAILENVDLIFKKNFNIVFNRINLDMTAGDEFPGSTNIEDVLEYIAFERYEKRAREYDPNPSSLFHFITGRDYTEDGDTAIGLAFVSEYAQGQYPNGVTPRLCTQQAAGTSMVFGENPSEKIALTSLLVSHELGHNFGFEHDGEGNAQSCPSDQFLMAPSLTPELQQFSSCSRAALGPNINAISNIESCFDFPADAILAEGTGTVKSTPHSQPFETRYFLSLEKKSDFNVQVNGSLNGSSTLNSVTLAGTPCVLGNANQSYTCTLDNASPLSELVLSITPAGSEIQISQQVSIPAGQNILETDESNNQLNGTITLTTLIDPDPVDPDPVDPDPVDPDPVDPDPVDPDPVDPDPVDPDPVDPDPVDPDPVDPDPVDPDPIDPDPATNLAPANLTITRNDNGLTLHWLDRSDNETGFTLERRLNDAPWSELASLPANSQNYVDTDLNSSAEYHYRVTALFESGQVGVGPEAAILIELDIPRNAGDPTAPVAAATGGGGSLGWLSLILFGYLPFRSRARKP